MNALIDQEKKTMKVNNIKMINVNETMANRSSVDQDSFILFAGHLLIVFYCLFFIFGFLGMKK
jgi:transketolase N-terminal domain/subunit